MFFYVPSATQAYTNILEIQSQVTFGLLTRNIHRWAAHLMVFFVFLHMMRVFYHGAYKPPREFNWVVGVVLLFLASRRQREETLTLVRDLEVARAQGQRWRSDARSYLNGLGEAIEAQFSRWNLTEAEREVALLLLKGLSLKEIAAVRSTTERTIRAQAHALYAKAGLSGRASLSAFFLEDLLAPIERPE